MKKIFFNTLIKLLIKNKSAIKTEFVDKFETVCFFSNTAIGDTLFNTPVFREFKVKFPNKKAIALLNPINYELFKNNPHIDEIVLFNGRWNGFLKALKQLKTKNIDIAFILHSNEPQATPLALLSGAKYIFKQPNGTDEFAKYRSNSKWGYNGEVRYAVLNRLEYLKFIGIDSNNTKMELFLDSSDIDIVKDDLKKEENIKYIGIQMGASTLSRQWFLHRWIELCKMLLKDGNYKLILTGSPKEKSMCNELKNELKSENVLNYAGKFDIKKAAALIGQMDLFITPDTGPLHIAVALNVPTITLFAMANPIFANPNYDTHIHKFIKKPITCKTCITKRCKYQECMLQISANEVYDMAKDILYE